jgi:hypothetical protein
MLRYFGESGKVSGQAKSHPDIPKNGIDIPFLGICGIIHYARDRHRSC